MGNAQNTGCSCMPEGFCCAPSKGGSEEFGAGGTNMAGKIAVYPDRKNDVSSEVKAGSKAYQVAWNQYKKMAESRDDAAKSRTNPATQYTQYTEVSSVSHGYLDQELSRQSTARQKLGASCCPVDVEEKSRIPQSVLTNEIFSSSSAAHTDCNGSTSHQKNLALVS
jgi:hypothetical protein